MTKKQLEITKKCSIVWQNVEYLKGVKGVTDAELSKAVNRSKATLVNRRQHPKNTTLEDLVKLGRYFEVEPASLLLPFMPNTAPTIEECVEDDE